MNNLTAAGVVTLSLITFLIFTASCVITASDGQGAFIFIFTIPMMAALLFGAALLARKSRAAHGSRFRLELIPKIFSVFLVFFFVSAFIPGVRIIPGAVMGLIAGAFTQATGKTPYVYFKERASFPNRLLEKLKTEKVIVFSEVDVTFAWDKVCIFGPYTNNAKAQSILKLDWNIEERSQIQSSDSINALVFLYQGKVNQVVDLYRGTADFKELDLCLDRPQSNFNLETDAQGRKVLSLRK